MSRTHQIALVVTLLGAVVIPMVLAASQARSVSKGETFAASDTVPVYSVHGANGL